MLFADKPRHGLCYNTGMTRDWLLLGLAVCCAVGCSRRETKDAVIATPADLVGRKCAVVVGSMMGDMTQKVQPGIGVEWFNDYNSGIEALRLGKVDAVPLDFFYARRWAAQNPGEFAITKPYHSIPWGFFFAKGSAIRDKVRGVLAKMAESGELKRILDKWAEADSPGALRLDALDYRADFTGKAGVFRFATPGDREPVSFRREDGIVGFDIDIARRVAYELDMTFEVVQISMGAIVPAVQGDKAEMGGGGIAITEARAEQVDFSDCYYRVPTVFLIRKTSAAARKSLETADDLKGRSCAAVTGTVTDEIARMIQPDLKFSWFNDYNAATEALLLGKVDALPMDTAIARRWVANRPDELRIAVTGGRNPYGYFLAKGSPLHASVNAELKKMIADGTVRRLIDKWSDAPDLAKVAPEPLPPLPTADGAAATLRIASSCSEEPGAFVRDGKVVGFDIDILGAIANRLGRRLEVIQIPHTARLDVVVNGKADVGFGCITITEERKKTVDFTDCYYDGGFAMLVKRERGDGIRTAADLRGKHVAHMSSDFHKRELRALQPAIAFDPYSEYAFAFESLRKGKIAAISIGRTYADFWLAKYPGEFRIAFDYADDTCAFLLPKGSPFKPRLDAEIRKMNAGGESARIYAKWCAAAKSGKAAKLPAFPPPPGNAPVVKVACAALSEPWCFVAADGVVGIDIEILLTAAHRLGWRLVPKSYSWGGMVDAVNGGKTDIACGGIYTGGNEFPTVDVSEKYADERMCVMALNGGGAAAQASAGSSWIADAAASLKASFVRTFVTEGRWRMMADGLGITLLITFLASALGTLLAFPLWMARTSRNRFVSACARWYISILQGTPVLVLLMVLFYLVFGKVDIDGIWVAVLGFALNSSAYFGEMLRSGINSIPAGQTEAALALGYPPRRAFFRFVLPQAVRAVLPVYRGELISTLKATSIVGYIAINDLTKASDLVRSRTYESFFPILTTAFIYFVAAWLLAWALDRLGRRLDPAFGRARAADKEGGRA